MYAVGLRRKIALLRLPRRHARRRTGEHPLDERHCARQLGPPVGRDAAVQSKLAADPADLRRTTHPHPPADL